MDGKLNTAQCKRTSASILTRFIRLMALVLLPGLMMLSASHSANAAKRMALVIGVDEYEEIAGLERAVGDAKAIAATLRKLDFEVTEVLNPNRRKLNRAISGFTRRLSQGDIAFVHFSGHGVEIDGDNYLLPSDAPRPEPGQSDFIQSEAVAMSRLLRQVESAGARTRLFVIDACRDNPFEQSGVRSIGSSRGLTRIEAPSGTFIMYSAGYRQQALDRLGVNDTEKTSVYTRVLLSKLVQPGKAISQIAKDIRKEVEGLAKSVGHDQRPAYYDELSSKLILVPAKSPEKVQSTKQPQVSSLYSPPAGGSGTQKEQPKVYNSLPPVTHAYEETKAIGTCDAYKVFEKTYSKGFYGGLARAWIKENCTAKPAKKVVPQPEKKKTGTQSISQAQKACTARLGINATLLLNNGNWDCVCKTGFKLNAAKTFCARITQSAAERRSAAAAVCTQKYGSKGRLTYFNETTNTSICGCDPGYEVNSYRTACVAKKKSYAEVVATVARECKRRYGAFAEIRSVRSEKDFDCGCASGYELNTSRLVCERKQVKTRSAMLSDALSSCRRKLGTGARVANLSDSGDFKCGCEAPYKLGPFGTHCMKETEKERRARYNQLCKKQYGQPASLAKLSADGTYNCNCGSNRTYDKKLKNCRAYSKRERRRQAIASCRKQYGKRYVRTVMHKNGTSTCYFRKSRKQAMREARAWCRKRYKRNVRRIKLRPIRGGRWQWTCYP